MNSAANAETLTFKVCLLGEGRVGKTSIISQYMNHSYVENQAPTIQAAYFDKKLNVDGHRLKLSIWDTAGQERFHALGPIYYRDSKGAVLVYDITDLDSFRRVTNWVSELQQVLGDDCILMIVGNKIDLESERKVKLQDAVSFAKSVNAVHYQTSAKVNRGIDELFLGMSKALINKHLSQAATGGSNNPSNLYNQQQQIGNVLLVTGDDARLTKPHSSKCCG